MGHDFRYTEEERKWLDEFIPGHHYHQIAAEFLEVFGHEITITQINAYCKNNQVKTGFDGRFQPGQVSHNKGKKMVTKGRMAETQFKPGNRPWNWKPVGSERVNVDGYIEIKVEEPKKWVHKHRLVWESYYGPIPKGYVVTFKDNDRTNCAISNLMLITQRQNQAINRLGLSAAGPEMKESVIALADLMIATSDAKRKRK